MNKPDNEQNTAQDIKDETGRYKSPSQIDNNKKDELREKRLDG